MYQIICPAPTENNGPTHRHRVDKNKANTLIAQSQCQQGNKIKKYKRTLAVISGALFLITECSIVDCVAASTTVQQAACVAQSVLSIITFTGIVTWCTLPVRLSLSLSFFPLNVAANK